MSNQWLFDVEPNDTGSDVLRRYEYQAHIAFRYCLQCCIGSNISSVFFEHFEDVLIQFNTLWHMMQIKTKNPELGPWKLTETLGKSGGILGLSRTYKIIKNYNVTFGLYLEGAIAKDDDLNLLVLNKKRIDSGLIHRIGEAIGLNESDSEDFLDRLSVHPNNPHRNHIAAQNIQLLGQVSPSTSQGEVRALYRKCINRISDAMKGDPLGDELGQLFDDNQDSTQQMQSYIESKQLTKEKIIEILGSFVGGTYPLLKRITNIEMNSPTNLEAKLIAGGASERIISDAINLRANAAIRIAEISAMDLYNNNQNIIEDISLRLITLANSIIESNSSLDAPAQISWKEILERIEKNPEVIDQNSLFKRDPYLLLGYISEITDQCKLTWGVPVE